MWSLNFSLLVDSLFDLKHTHLHKYFTMSQSLYFNLVLELISWINESEAYFDNSNVVPFTECII